MCDFYTLDDASKKAYHQRLTTCAEAFGGTNFFLHLIEAIRATKPHALLAKNSEFRFPLGSIKWNKVIFNDKLLLLQKILEEKPADGNLLADKEHKKYKSIVNLVRTLKPIHFTVTPQNPEDGKGFTVLPFDIIGEESTLLNPIFDALFFCPIGTVKSILSYTEK